MKKTYIFVFLIFVLFKNQAVFSQYLQLTYPVYQGVYQRNTSDNADIPVSGQVFGFPTSTPGTYKIECITNRLDANGVVISGTSSTTLITNNTLKGYFNGSINRSKGWYSLQVKFTFNATGYNSVTSSKFGVGDVFVIAGQSNGQGIPAPWDYPSTVLVPEWIVGNNEDWNCRKEFENRPSMTKIDGANRISPTGNSSWCYGILGQKISVANGGMPVAFFNCAYGGSSVLNWKESADGSGTLHPYNTQAPNYVTPSQYCNNSNPYVADPQFIGQPYLSFKNTLNWYVQLFGVRAVLWHQGESDADNNTTVSVSKFASTYTSNLNYVISKSREHSSIPNLSWMVANVSFTKGNKSGGTTADVNASQVLQGQVNATNGATVKIGPLTDKYLGSSTAIHRDIIDQTHFREGTSYNNGLSVLNNLWGGFIDPSSLTTFNRISAKTVPPVLITQSGSTYTFSISPVSNADYCWTSGSTLAPPANSLLCLSTGTSITSGSSVRCFIGTNNSTFTAKNWVATGSAGPQNCPGCREGVEEIDETYGGINMKLYPNPSDKDFRVEFDVLEDDTHVKLEFFDVAGKSVKVIADGSHAKGHFNYPITESLPTGLIICQLKVGDIYISRKLSRVN